MPSKLKVESYMSVEDLNTHIRKFEGDCKTATRLHLIKLAMKTGNLKEACEILDIPIKTGQDWVKKWNKNGIDGLRHKKGAGRPSYLLEGQFEELDEWMEGKEYLVTKDVYSYIKEHFGIDYSIKQVRRIVKKLNYTWVSPYPIADEQAENAEELLKEKTEIIDSNKDIYGFLDETAVQNTPNVGKIIKKKDPDLKLK
jgi:putative transposase